MHLSGAGLVSHGYLLDPGSQANISEWYVLNLSLRVADDDDIYHEDDDDDEDGLTLGLTIPGSIAKAKQFSGRSEVTTISK